MRIYADIHIITNPPLPEPWHGRLYYLPASDVYYLEMLKQTFPKTNLQRRIAGFRYVACYGDHVWPAAIDITGEHGAIVDVFSDPSTIRVQPKRVVFPLGMFT
jgi:hypothetical protein